MRKLRVIRDKIKDVIESPLQDEANVFLVFFDGESLSRKVDFLT